MKFIKLGCSPEELKVVMISSYYDFEARQMVVELVSEEQGVHITFAGIEDGVPALFEGIVECVSASAEKALDIINGRLEEEGGGKLDC